MKGTLPLTLRSLGRCIIARNDRPAVIATVALVAAHGAALMGEEGQKGRGISIISCWR